MKKISLFALLGVLLLIVIVLPNPAPARADEPTSGRIFGYTFQSNGWMLLPIPFVQIAAGGQHVTSDLVGYYEINDLSLGQVYTVQAQKIGFRNISTVVELTTERPVVQVDFILSIRSDLTKVVVIYYRAASGDGLL